jgi:hypothetical protein
MEESGEEELGNSAVSLTRYHDNEKLLGVRSNMGYLPSVVKNLKSQASQRARTLLPTGTQLR